MDCYSAQEFRIHLPLAAGRIERNSSIKGPSNVPVRTRSEKRKTCPGGETPKKRKKGSKSPFGSLTDTDVRTKARKRPASGYQEGTRKRQRTSQTELCKVSGDFVRVSKRKRKATENGEGQMKRQRVSKLKQCKEESGDATSSSLEAATPRKENGEGPRKRQRSELQHNNSAVSTSKDTSRQQFEVKYHQLNPLGEGGHGSVYAGYRRVDHFPVAIKHIPRDNVICKHIMQNRRTLPLEVAVMMKMASGAAGSVGKSAAISLLDYYDLDQEVILVLERPVPSVDLLQYIKVKGGSLQEEEGRLLLKQLVEAARELQSKNIFHRDIKVENILIETSTDVPRLRLIDFGLSCFTKKTSSYRIFYGTSAHIPPEWYQCWTYRAGPTTIWQLGLVLYDMLHRHTHFETTRFLSNELKISDDLSQNCQDVLRLCLAEDPQQRPSLEQLRLHAWLA